jgi:hypothetical protein
MIIIDMCQKSTDSNCHRASGEGEITVNLGGPKGFTDETGLEINNDTWKKFKYMVEA